MIFCALMLVLFLVVIFFHYLEGFFTATISAIASVMAAMLAMGYHEAIVASLLKGNMADMANSIVICGVFAVSYIIIRVIVDMLVPGNVRLPVTFDKVGGAVMGVIAALFSTGIVAIAAQSMPFGPSIWGFSRYELVTTDQQIQLKGQKAQIEDGWLIDQMKSNSLTTDRNSLWIPADEFVVGAISMMSGGGSLASDTSFKQVHPDFLQELFGQRVSVQTGVRHTMLNFAGMEEQVKVDGVFALASVDQMDSDYPTVHKDLQIDPKKKLVSTNEKVFFVVRTIFTNSAPDENDKIVRLGPASVRLVAGGKNYYPVGTLENAQTLLINRIDDYIFVDVSKADAGADFVFEVDNSDLAKTLGNDVFIEVKRYGRVSLAGKTVDRIKPSPAVAVMRKEVTGIKRGEATPAATATVTQAPKIEADSLFKVENTSISNKLPTKIGVNSPDETAMLVNLPGGQASLKTQRFDTLELDPEKLKMRELENAGDRLVSEFSVPTGKKMVQVKGRPGTKSGSDAWQWAKEVTKFEVVDTSGAKHRISGAWSKVKIRSEDYLIARYTGEGEMSAIKPSEGTPTDVYLAFLIPDGVEVKELQFGGSTLSAISVK